MFQLLIITLSIIGTATAQEDLRHIFENARMLEERNTNLPEALRLYGEVAAKGKGQRALAARARYQQGVLLARLGRRPEARNAWRTVIVEFPEQADLVRQARLRLNASGQTSKQVIQRRVGDGDQFSNPSLDGRLLAYTDWKSGNLAIRNIVTGEERPLTRKREKWNQSSAQASGAVFSPNGKHIAYQWLDGNTLAELRLVAADGSGDRLLFRDPELWACKPLAWSPDGKRILLHSYAKNRTSWLAYVEAAGGTPVPVSRQQHRWIGTAIFDREGSGVVSTVYRNGAAGDIVYIEPGGSERTLVNHPAHDFVIGWTPAGRLLFGSDRMGPVSIWALRVEDGSPQGEPLLIKQDAGPLWPLRLTRAGSLFYLLSTGMMDVYTAVLDLAAGTVVDPPRTSAYAFAGVSAFPSWSPDGAKLLFFSRRNPRHGTPVIFEPGPNRVREVIADIELPARPQWDPDGVSIFAFGTDSRGQRGHFRINPESGQSSLVFPIEQTDSEFEGAWSHDGRYFFTRPTNWRKGIYRLDAGNGEKSFLYVPGPGIFLGKENLAPSPDGRLLAFHAVGPQAGVSSVMIIPVEGGEAKPLFSIKDPAQFAFGAFAWTPDSKILLASFGPEGRHEVWKIPLDGSTPAPTGLTMPRIARLRLNPDGKTVAFHCGQGGSEIWVLENFLQEKF